MDEQKFTFSGSFKKTREYVDTQIELLKLKAVAKTSRLISGLLLDIGSLLIVILIVFFLSLALGFFLGELMGSIALGFLTTGAFFLLILIILKSVEPKLEVRLMNKIVKRLLSICEEEFDSPIGGGKRNSEDVGEEGGKDND